MKQSAVDTRWVFMFDGDNTLWDTNAVFTEAQMAVLRELRKASLKFRADNGFKILRQIDDRLISYYHTREYDFTKLFLALFLHFDGSTQTESVRRATRMDRGRIPHGLYKTIKSCSRAFQKEMRKIPPLFPGVKSTLRTLRRRPSVIFLFSEGNVARVLGLVRILSLERYFDHIFVRKKTYTLYAHARKRALNRLPSLRWTKVMVVGDLLDPDIRIGNRIRAITVLRLGGYKPSQQPKDELEKPSYTIGEISELISIVEKEERPGN